MSELSRRILFGVVAAPVALAIIYFGDAALATLLAALAAAAAWEFFRIARATGEEPLATIGIALAAAVPLLVHGEFLGVFLVPRTLAPLAMLGLLAAAVWTRGVSRRPLGAAAVTAFGVVYTGVALSYGYALRYHGYTVGPSAGTALVMFPLVLTWVSDIGAYAVGRTLGRRRLIPSVSPGKTVAGCVGALVLSAFASWAYIVLVLVPVAQLALAAWWALAFGLTISVAAQIGDLAESLLKRAAGMKDSSTLIPGHGGVLDRFDSLLFVLPLAWLMLGWLLIPAPAPPLPR
ncbi:MAG: phosphatidate cytidylyltransferase [Gemmatimonadaceae bacterium]